MRKPAFIALLLLALLPPLRAAEPENFLLLLDTSRAMAKQSRVLQQTVVELVNNGVYGRMRRGDRLVVWTFNEKILPAKIPVQVWAPESRGAVALTTVSHVEKVSYEKQAKLDVVISELLDRIKQAGRVTVVLVSDGGSVMFGTPFDRDLNLFYGTHFDQFKQAGWLFVTSFLANRGVLEAWAINANGDRILLPDSRAEAKPAEPAPPSVAPPVADKAAPPAQPKAAQPAPDKTAATFTVPPPEAKAEPPKKELPKGAAPPPATMPATTTAAVTTPAPVEFNKSAFQPAPAVGAKPAGENPAARAPVAGNNPASLSQKSSAVVQPVPEAPATALAKLDSAPAKLESSRPQVEAPAPVAAPKPPPAGLPPVEKAAPNAPAPAAQTEGGLNAPSSVPKTLPTNRQSASAAQKEASERANDLPPGPGVAGAAVPDQIDKAATPAQTAIATPPESRRGWFLALGLGLLVMAGGGVYFIFRIRSTPRPSLISRSMRRDRR